MDNTDVMEEFLYTYWPGTDTLDFTEKKITLENINNTLILIAKSKTTQTMLISNMMDKSIMKTKTQLNSRNN